MVRFGVSRRTCNVQELQTAEQHRRHRLVQGLLLMQQVLSNATQQQLTAHIAGAQALNAGWYATRSFHIVTARKGGVGRGAAGGGRRAAGIETRCAAHACVGMPPTHLCLPLCSISPRAMLACLFAYLLACVSTLMKLVREKMMHPIRCYKYPLSTATSPVLPVHTGSAC